MRAIIIAAGQGTRLRPHTADRPKCMVEVAGKPILHHQIHALQSNGIDDILVIGGYKRQGIAGPNIRVIPNKDYLTNNILQSLFSAGADLVGDVVVSYGDILYSAHVVESLLGTYFPSALVIDREWEKIYDGRTDHPIEQAELCEVAENGLVLRAGKKVGPDYACGEFIGLARFDSAMVARLWALYLDTMAQGEDQPFVDAPTLRKAYLTDLLNAAIRNGEQFGMVPIHGGWREIDTVQDLERVRATGEW